MNSDDPVDEVTILTIVGEKVSLGPIRRDLQLKALRWLNDLDVTRTFSRRPRPLTLEASLAIYDRVSDSDSDIVFLIYENAQNRPIGYAGLYDIDEAHRTADLTILIGEKSCWGKGYGTETARLLVDYGFNVLNLHNILARAYSYNERGLRAAKRVGFREIGRRRESHWRGGRPYDMVFMDCLATEFRNSRLRELPSNDDTSP